MSCCKDYRTTRRKVRYLVPLRSASKLLVNPLHILLENPFWCIIPYFAVHGGLKQVRSGRSAFEICECYAECCHCKHLRTLFKFKFSRM